MIALKDYQIRVLDSLRKFLGVKTEGAHRALKDAMDCREVFYRALAER